MVKPRRDDTRAIPRVYKDASDRRELIGCKQAPAHALEEIRTETEPGLSLGSFDPNNRYRPAKAPSSHRFALT